MTLTQKEKDLLKDLKDQEKLCVDKYKKHADAAPRERASRPSAPDPA